MTDENQDSIRKTLAEALNKIYAEHGVCITLLTADWLHLRSSRERKSTVTSLEIGAKL